MNKLTVDSHTPGLTTQYLVKPVARISKSTTMASLEEFFNIEPIAGTTDQYESVPSTNPHIPANVWNLRCQQ